MPSPRTVLACLSFAAAAAAPVSAGEAPAGARVHNLKVLSGALDDVTTAENILASFVKPGMKDEERAKALWTAVVRYRHQTAPPHEYFSPETEDVHDPAKLFNVYGYCMCCCCSALVACLNRLDGREARGRILNGHSVPEVKYGGAWHLYDASLITYFPKPGNGDVASVDEISEAVTAWLDKNPDYRKNEKKLGDFMRADGWTGWKKGPDLLTACPFYTLGWFPARTHGWYSTMLEYDGPRGHYEYGYQVGHRALFSLRPGESFVREAGHRGLHIDGDPGFPNLKSRAPQEDLGYLKTFLPGYTGGVVGNGRHRYAPDLAAGGLGAGAEVFENLVSAAGSPALRPAAAGKPGVAVVPMVSPWVYLGGRLSVKAVRRTEADRVSISLSTNNGRTFAPLWSAEKTGAVEAEIDLKDRIVRRYGYLLKIEIAAATPDGAGLDALALEHDLQHAPRTMTWLAPGDNTITVSADGGDTRLATRSVACRITPDAAFAKNETSGTMGFTFENLDLKDYGCWWKGGTGAMTVPLETPGDMVALRFSAHVRARGDKDAITVKASFDGGASWKEAAKIAGPTPGVTQAFRFADVPPGSRKAQLRFELTGNNTIGIFNIRADADYRDPSAASAPRPFKVVHRWKEGGQEKVHEQAVATLPFTYKIPAGAAPEMVSASYEMPSR